MSVSLTDFLGAQTEVLPPLSLSDSRASEPAQETPEGRDGTEDLAQDSVPPPDWSLPIERFSATSLNMLAVCPRQYQQRYIHHRKEPPSQAQVLGNSFHRTMEFNFRHKQVTQDDLPVDELNDYFIGEAFPDSVDDAEKEGEVVWQDREDALLSGTKMVVAYRREVAPRVIPIEVEYQFKVEVPGIPVPVVGQIDVVTAETIIDLKTSKRKASKMKGSWRNQGRIYQLSHTKETAFHVVTTKGDIIDPDLFTIPFTMRGWLATEKWVRNLAWTANFYYEKFGPDEDWPATGTVHDWRCDWCGYRGDCPVWR